MQGNVIRDREKGKGKRVIKGNKMGRLGRISQDESRGGFFISMENRLIIGIRREFEGQSRSINKTLKVNEVER